MPPLSLGDLIMALYEYVCPKCGAVYEKIAKSSERLDEVPCFTEGCDSMASYIVSAPAFFRIKFDAGGRIGYKVDSGNGKIQYRSATREKYEHTIGNRSEKDLKAMAPSEKSQSVYTKEYDKHVRAKEKETLDKANRELVKVIKGEKK